MTSPAPILSQTATWQTLLTLDRKSDDFAHLARQLLSDQRQYSRFKVSEFSKDEALELIELIEPTILQHANMPSDLKGTAFTILQRLCGAFERLPGSFLINKDFKIQGEIPFATRTYANLWRRDWNGRGVAVKALRLAPDDDGSKMTKRFCEEVLLWKLLDHPNILTFYGASLNQNQLCMVSPWMENGNVLDYTKKNPKANRLRLLIEVASGLKHLHRMSLAHGNIRGSNILISDDKPPRALLGDFSLKTTIFDPFSLEGALINQTAPKLLTLDGARPTIESDIYALATVIYEVLTGTPPFEKIGENERPCRPRDSEKLGFTDKLWGSLGRCWDKKPYARPTIDAVSACLKQAAETWVVDVPASMIASEAGAEQVVGMKGDRAEGFADRIDEIIDQIGIHNFSPQTLNQISISQSSGKTYDSGSELSEPTHADHHVAPALYLYPLDDSFVSKHIALLPQQRVKIGRKKNVKTVPAERNGYFDSKVLSKQHAEVWEQDGKIYIKDVKSSNGTFINGERLSGEGLESEPFELKSDDMVEFGIDIVDKHNRSIIHHKVAARVLCVLNEQDAQAAAHAEQQQLAQNPPGYALSNHHQNMTSTADPSNAFNFNGQGPAVGGQRRPAMQPQGHVDMINPGVQPQASPNETTIRALHSSTVDLTPDLSILVDDLEAPACERLISHTFSPHEVISLVETVFANKDEVKMVREFRGDAAQTFIDVVHGALCLPDLLPRLRRNCLKALYRICGQQGLLPRSLQIPLCYDRSDTPLYSGGYADVWMGEYRGYRVAVKVLRVYSTSNFDRVMSRFCKEVVMWNTLRHPNVLSLVGVVMGKNQFAMASEWMDNGNINEFVKAHRDVDRFELLKDVARGLIYMHDQAMIHGDLKGANILIDRTGHACLADFGLLTIISDPTIFTASSYRLARGTTRWMSPELLDPDRFNLKDCQPTKESDSYSLGMVIYEVLSGQIPFAQWNEWIVMRKVIEGERPAKPEGAERAWFTDDLWETLTQCWATQPQSRPGVEAALECLNQVSGTWTPPSPLMGEDVEMDGSDWEFET